MGAYKKDAHTTVWAFFCAYNLFIFHSKSIVIGIIETYINRYILINVKMSSCVCLMQEVLLLPLNPCIYYIITNCKFMEFIVKRSPHVVVKPTIFVLFNIFIN